MKIINSEEGLNNFFELWNDDDKSGEEKWEEMQNLPGLELEEKEVNWEMVGLAITCGFIVVVAIILSFIY